MYKLVYTESYINRAKRFIKKHPEIINQYRKTLQLLEINPVHPSLKLHKLKGKFSELFSVSVNISYRIVLEFMIQEKEIILINVGSHDELYR